jgi:hypothetical protein
VALIAPQTRVHAFERVSGLSMVERRPALLAPEHEIEIPPVVLDVTAAALLVPGLGVQSSLGLDARPQRGMASQALVHGHPAPRLVALQAPGASVEAGVSATQLPRRDLRAPRSRHAREKQRERHQPPTRHRDHA